jgi:hypothetical protein
MERRYLGERSSAMSVTEMSYEAEITKDPDSHTLTIKLTFEKESTMDAFIAEFSAWIATHTRNMGIGIE